MSGLERLIDYGLPCVALVYGAILVETAGWRAARLAERVGDWSYSTYLSHIFVIAMLVHWLPPMRADHWLAEAALECGLMTAVILVGACSYHFLEAPLGKLVRRGWPRMRTNYRQERSPLGPMVGTPQVD